MKHTPGPWEAFIGGNFISIYKKSEMKRSRHYLGRENGHVARVNIPWKGKVDDHLGDGHLIAAAPELLKAVKCTHNVIRNILTDSQLDTKTKCGKTVRRWLAACEKAIKKAESRRKEPD